MTRQKAGIFALLCFCSLCAVASAFAETGAEEIVVRFKAIPEAPWQGEKVILQLDVLAKNGWAQIPSFDDIKWDGGLLRRYETQGTRLSEKIAGTEYAGQRYEFFLFALRSGTLRLPPQPLAVEVKQWGEQIGAQTKEVETPPLVIAVQKVPGLSPEATPVSSEHFAATQSWQPEKNNLRIGDAVTRTITREGTGVTAMLFSPLQEEKIDGLGIYTGEPTVNDSFARGDLSGKRTEIITYMMERKGIYRLPDLQFLWYDVQTEKLEKIVLPGLELKVAESTQAAAPKAGHSRGKSVQYLPLGLILLVFSIIFAKWRSIVAHIRHWQKRHQHSEKAHFAKITRTIRSQSGKDVILRATMQWLDILPGIDKPARLDRFLQQFGNQADANLTTITEKKENGSWSPTPFYQDLYEARKAYLKWQKKKQNKKNILPKVGLQAREL
jgi:hypothetical protein